MSWIFLAVDIEKSYTDNENNFFCSAFKFNYRTEIIKIKMICYLMKYVSVFEKKCLFMKPLNLLVKFEKL